MRSYWERVKEKAHVLGGDGCSHVPDLWFRICCDEHDIAYRTHLDAEAVPTGKWRADWKLARCLMRHSPLRRVNLGWLSPLAWLYWAGVTVLGVRAWYRADTGYQRPRPAESP